MKRLSVSGMKLGLLASLVLLAVLAVVLIQGGQDLDLLEEKKAGKSNEQQVLEAYGKLPLYFIENQGQIDPRVAYYIQGGDKSIYFTPEGVTFALTAAGEEEVSSEDFAQPADSLGRGVLAARSRSRLGLDLVHLASYGETDALRAPSRSRLGFKTTAPSRSRPGLGLVQPAAYGGTGVLPAPSRSRLGFKPTAPSRSRLGLGEARRWVVKVDFVDANPNALPVGQEPTAAVISYFKGPQEEWNTGLPTYAELAYRDLWPGIDLVYTGTGSHLKYTFAVQPGADPNQIKLAYRGASGVQINEAGQLEVSTPVEDFQEDKPYVYQEVDGQRMEVEAAYSLEGEVSDGVQFGFRVGTYDPQKVLVIDPVILLYAGYIGGSGGDEGSGIAVDSTGNAYITGTTASGDFPVMGGLDMTFNGGGEGAFVAKVNPAGTALVYAGYIGGSNTDLGFDIAVDSTGNAYITGATASGDFPVMGVLDMTFNGGGLDAFVVKVNASGTALDYAGYIGGSGHDAGQGIAVDSTSNAYVTGETESDETTFPKTVGPDLTYNGGQDAFVAKVNASGTALVYAGYIGGSSPDHAERIAVDSAGSAYVTGPTESDETTFPKTVGPDLTYNGGQDAFVAKVNASGTVLDYAGYIGGSSPDHAERIAVDFAGNAYITGATESDEATFPVTGGLDLTFNGGGQDAFVAKVNASGTALVYAGYIGGSSDEISRGIAVDSAGNAYVSGETESSDFPVTVGPDLTFDGPSDAFVAKIGEQVVISIAIDIKPGSDPNSINRGGQGVIPVAILSDATFDAMSVDTTSLTFGGTGDEDSLSFCNGSPGDVDGDGLPDLMCHFDTQETDFQSGDTEGVLKGTTLDGTPITGTDSVRIVR